MRRRLCASLLLCVRKRITACFCRARRWCSTKSRKRSSSLSATDPERPYLESLAAELGITDSVKFLGTRADIPRLLALCDVFVLTSHIEANPVSILEAMASGKPVVATRVGSVAESVLHGQTGYLVEPGDARQIAARVLALFDRPLEARKLGAAGREQVVSRWSLQAMVDGYQTLISELYQARRGVIPSDVCPTDGVTGTTRDQHAALR